MPAIGTDALHIALVGGTAVRTVHHRRPVVEITVIPHIPGMVIPFVAGTIEIRSSETRFLSPSDFVAVRIVRGLKILFHPALVADFHCVIDVAVDVGHCWGARTRLGIAGGQQGQRDGFSTFTSDFIEFNIINAEIIAAAAGPLRVDIYGCRGVVPAVPYHQTSLPRASLRRSVESIEPITINVKIDVCLIIRKEPGAKDVIRMRCDINSLRPGGPIGSSIHHHVHAGAGSMVEQGVANIPRPHLVVLVADVVISARPVVSIRIGGAKPCVALFEVAVHHKIFLIRILISCHIVGGAFGRNHGDVVPFVNDVSVSIRPDEVAGTCRPKSNGLVGRDEGVGCVQEWFFYYIEVHIHDTVTSQSILKYRTVGAAVRDYLSIPSCRQLCCTYNSVKLSGDGFGHIHLNVFPDDTEIITRDIVYG